MRKLLLSFLVGLALLGCASSAHHQKALIFSAYPDGTLGDVRWGTLDDCHICWDCGSAPTGAGQVTPAVAAAREKCAANGWTDCGKFFNEPVSRATPVSDAQIRHDHRVQRIQARAILIVVDVGCHLTWQSCTETKAYLQYVIDSSREPAKGKR
jgi:hypothetical protein